MCYLFDWNFLVTPLDRACAELARTQKFVAADRIEIPPTLIDLAGSNFGPWLKVPPSIFDDIEREEAH